MLLFDLYLVKRPDPYQNLEILNAWTHCIKKKIRIILMQAVKYGLYFNQYGGGENFQLINVFVWTWTAIKIDLDLVQ